MLKIIIFCLEDDEREEVILLGGLDFIVVLGFGFIKVSLGWLYRMIILNFEGYV